MPNWCQNYLTLRHEDPNMIIRARKAFEAGELLNEFIPIPKDLTETIRGWFGDQEKQKELDIAQAYNLKNYGYKDWYEFCAAEWGTKWDVGGKDCDVDPIDPNTISMSFDSAWAPPVNAYKKLDTFGFDVVAYYFEPGVGFCGTYTTQEGEDHYDFEAATQEWVQENIPKELDDFFAISDTFAQWEAEGSE